MLKKEQCSFNINSNAREVLVDDPIHELKRTIEQSENVKKVSEEVRRVLEESKIPILEIEKGINDASKNALNAFKQVKKFSDRHKK